MPTPTSIRFEQDAEKWDEAGRPIKEPFDAWYIVTLNCWAGSDGAKKEGVSPRLKDYLAALMTQLEREQPNWFDDLFDDREYCKTCGTSWRSENVSFCTSCSATYSPCHMPEVYVSNGNRECPACKRGEIVG